MAQGSIAKLPKLGEIKLPVHLMVYDDKVNPEKHFHSGFAYWWAADGTSEVTDNDGNVIGMIGGKMGGHVEMSRYYPHNGQPHENGKYKQWTTAIIDVRDIWDQIEALLDSPGVRVQLDGIEEVNAKYQAIKAAERQKKDADDKKLEEIKQMQREAEELQKSQSLSELASALRDRSDAGELQPVGVYPIGDIDIYEDNNWDLSECLDGMDIEFYDKKEQKGIRPNRDTDGKIPLNIGCGVRMAENRNGKPGFLFSDRRNQDNKVTLSITSWIGTSPGAIHYYGNLKFSAAYVHPENDPNCSTSCWDVPLFNRAGNIRLTRILEKWELSKYPYNYDGWKAGDVYSGFYSPEDVIKRAEEVFNDLFSGEWKLKVEKNY
jgi:hypothetical protein